MPTKADPLWPHAHVQRKHTCWPAMPHPRPPARSNITCAHLPTLAITCAHTYKLLNPTPTQQAHLALHSHRQLPEQLPVARQLLQKSRWYRLQAVQDCQRYRPQICDADVRKGSLRYKCTSARDGAERGQTAAQRVGLELFLCTAAGPPSPPPHPHTGETHANTTSTATHLQQLQQAVGRQAVDAGQQLPTGGLQHVAVRLRPAVHKTKTGGT